MLHKGEGLLRDALVAHVREAHPDVRLAEHVREPAIGALMLTLDALHGATNARMIEAIERTHPPAALFAT